MYLIFLINFLLAISTTIGMTIIPFLVTDSLGLSLVFLGLMEGATEFFSNLLRLTNGILFDKIKNKRILFVFSTSVAFVAKALLLWPSPSTIFLAKTFERIANGAFASPRDAFVAENVKNKGLGLGFLNISKTAGCIIGPLIVSVSIFFLGNLKDNLQYFVILGCLTVLPAVFCSFFLNVKSPTEVPFSFSETNKILKKIIPILMLAFLFFMGRFNDGLLMVHLKQQGFPEWFYLSTIAVFNTIMLIVSPLMGKQIDNNHSNKMMYITICALVGFNFCFFQMTEVAWLYASFGLIAWGIQRTGAQIVFSCLIFKSIDKTHYGTAIGIFYLVSGFATLLASCLCGYIAKVSLSYVFIFSGFCSFIALVFAARILNNKSLGFGLKTKLKLADIRH